MAKARKLKQANDSGLNFEGQLWAAADKLRGVRGWLRVDRLFGEKGIPKGSDAGRQQFASDMERRRAEESAVDYEEIRKAWYLGSEAFSRDLLAAASERVGLNHYGAERHETGVQKAGWPENELRRRSRSDFSPRQITPGEVSLLAGAKNVS